IPQAFTELRDDIKLSQGKKKPIKDIPEKTDVHLRIEDNEKSVELKLTVPAAPNRDSPDRQQEGVISGGWQAARGQVAEWRPEGSERGGGGGGGGGRPGGRGRGRSAERGAEAGEEPGPAAEQSGARAPADPDWPEPERWRRGERHAPAGADGTGPEKRRGRRRSSDGRREPRPPGPSCPGQLRESGEGEDSFYTQRQGTLQGEKRTQLSAFQERGRAPPNFLVPRRWNRAEPLRSDLQRTERALHSRQIQFGGEGDSPKGEETTPGWERLLPSSPGSPAECGDCATFPRWDRLLLPLPHHPPLLRGPSSPPQLGRLSQVQEEPLKMRLFICL
ncbi:hypothetical protein EI555_018177, partial [Monodon monoceros]